MSGLGSSCDYDDRDDCVPDDDLDASYFEQSATDFAAEEAAWNAANTFTTTPNNSHPSAVAVMNLSSAVSSNTSTHSNSLSTTAVAPSLASALAATIAHASLWRCVVCGCGLAHPNDAAARKAVAAASSGNASLNVFLPTFYRAFRVCLCFACSSRAFDTAAAAAQALLVLPPPTPAAAARAIADSHAFAAAAARSELLSTTAPAAPAAPGWSGSHNAGGTAVSMGARGSASAPLPAPLPPVPPPPPPAALAAAVAVAANSSKTTTALSSASSDDGAVVVAGVVVPALVPLPYITDDEAFHVAPWALSARSTLKNTFLLTDDDFFGLAFISKPNPTHPTWAPMRLYLTAQAALLALRRHGSAAGMRAEAQKRALARLQRRTDAAMAAADAEADTDDGGDDAAAAAADDGGASGVGGKAADGGGLGQFIKKKQKAAAKAEAKAAAKGVTKTVEKTDVETGDAYHDSEGSGDTDVGFVAKRSRKTTDSQSTTVSLRDDDGDDDVVAVDEDADATDSKGKIKGKAVKGKCKGNATAAAEIKPKTRVTKAKGGKGTDSAAAKAGAQQSASAAAFAQCVAQGHQYEAVAGKSGTSRLPRSLFFIR